MGLGHVSSRDRAHQLLYPMLRKYDFRAHTARNIYDAASALVKSARVNNGGEPTVGDLDYQDARVDVDNRVY